MKIENILLPKNIFVLSLIFISIIHSFINVFMTCTHKIKCCDLHWIKFIPQQKLVFICSLIHFRRSMMDIKNTEIPAHQKLRASSYIRNAGLA